MANLLKLQAIWTGFLGAPGYTTLYLAEIHTGGEAELRTFFDAIKSCLPPNASVTVQSEGLLVDEASGDAVGTWTGATQTAVVGTGSGAYAAASGAVINWKSSAFLDGRRVQGKSYIVPMSGGAFGTDGTLDAAELAILQAAAAALVTSMDPDLKVWHRPVGGVGGASYTVTTSSVPDKAVVLRSRRD